MTFLTATFFYLAGASVASALLAITRKNPVHSVLWVLVLFLHVAGLFLFLNAEFLAAVQIILYAGAILVFYLFVLMLLDVPTEEAQGPFGAHWPVAAAAGLAFVGLAWMVGRGGAGLTGSSIPPSVDASETADLGSLRAVGEALFGPFALPFEIASLILLAAIVGAVVLARRRTAAS